MKQTRLAALRRYENISQEKMAKEAGMKFRTYVSKENGDSEFKLTEMFAISKVLGKPIENIFLHNDCTSCAK